MRPGGGEGCAHHHSTALRCAAPRLRLCALDYNKLCAHPKGPSHQQTLKTHQQGKETHSFNFAKFSRESSLGWLMHCLHCYASDVRLLLGLPSFPVGKFNSVLSRSIGTTSRVKENFGWNSSHYLTKKGGEYHEHLPPRENSSKTWNFFSAITVAYFFLIGCLGGPSSTGESSLYVVFRLSRPGRSSWNCRWPSIRGWRHCHHIAGNTMARNSSLAVFCICFTYISQFTCKFNILIKCTCDGIEIEW